MGLETIDFIMLALWVVIIIGMLVLEFITADLVSLWFICGGLVSAVSVFCHAPIWLQIILFAVVSTICLLATRPLLKKINNKDNIPTNADRLINKVALVTKDIILNEKGEVKVEYNFWPAISQKYEFKEGDKVVVKAIVGNKLLVSKIEEIEIN